MKFELTSRKDFDGSGELLSETDPLFTDNMLSLQDHDGGEWRDVVLTNLKVGESALGRFKVDFPHGNNFCVVKRVE